MIKNYVIGISNNEMSQQYLELCIPNIKKVTVNDEVNLWEGTVPETIPDGPLRFDLKEPTRGTKGNPPFTESEKHEIISILNDSSFDGFSSIFSDSVSDAEWSKTKDQIKKKFKDELFDIDKI